MMSASSGGSPVFGERTSAVEEQRLSTAVTVSALRVDASVGSKAYHALRDAILRTDIYHPDVDLRLDEKQMADNLGVSRTPVREALARLEQEGLVEIVPRRGTYISRKGKAEIIEMITVWAALESMAARLSAERASDVEISGLRELFDSFPSGEDLHYRLDEYSVANLRFHQAVIDISHSPLLHRMAAALLIHVRAIRGRTIHDKDRVNNSIVDHMHIIEALEARDAERAEQLVRDHALGLAEHVKLNVDYLQ
jgi:DNA-binding GntR family transcriptional regulator